MGIVSKIEDKAIISDVNINHGNSGGPLFAMDGLVLGITTFANLSDQGGPYGVDYNIKQAALKERSKRNSKTTSVQNTIDPFSDYKNWASYVGEFRPVLMLDARPKLVEGFWSALGRGVAESQGHYAGPANLHFKSDFYKMTLLCGDLPVTPIHPGKVEHRVAVANAAVKVNDATFEGLYTYPPDAISPLCGTVKVVLVTEKEPEKADVRIIPEKVVQRIWNDFAPYRSAAAER